MQRSLRAVRMLRERVEAREERALGEVSRQGQRAKAKAASLGEELALLQANGPQRTGALWTGIEHRQREEDLRSLKQREVEALEELKVLEQQRVEQMQLYRMAHADREAISQLMQQRERAYKAALEVQERKAGESLFLGRRALLREVERRAAETNPGQR